jgi:hypothetical protein
VQRIEVILYKTCYISVPTLVRTRRMQTSEIERLGQVSRKLLDMPYKWRNRSALNGGHNCNISTVKETRCTIFRVYWIWLYMFQTVFPSIIRSPRLYIHHQVYVILKFHKWIKLLLSVYIQSSNFIHFWNFSMIYTWYCMYSLGLLMMDGKTVWNM